MLYTYMQMLEAAEVESTHKESIRKKCNSASSGC